MKVTKVPTSTPDIQVTLSNQEAVHMLAIMGRIGGRGPLRETVDNLYRHLRQNDIEHVPAGYQGFQVATSMQVKGASDV